MCVHNDGLMRSNSCYFGLIPNYPNQANRYDFVEFSGRSNWLAGGKANVESVFFIYNAVLMALFFEH
jgi:hypothetical protein